MSVHVHLHARPGGEGGKATQGAGRPDGVSWCLFRHHRRISAEEMVAIATEIRKWPDGQIAMLRARRWEGFWTSLFREVHEKADQTHVHVEMGLVSLLKACAGLLAIALP